jgi:cytochrome b561
MLRNTDEAWGGLSKTFHWLFALAIAVEVPAGFLMSATFGMSLKHDDVQPLHFTLSQIHHTIGFFVLALVLLRLGWRLRHPTPALPAGLTIYHRWLARLNQGALYALLIAIPLSGWAALTSLADTAEYGKTMIWFFGTDSFPRMPFLAVKAPDDPTGYRFFGWLHRTLLVTGGCLLALHVVGALWHQFVRRDRVLLRMLPDTSSAK